MNIQKSFFLLLFSILSNKSTTLFEGRVCPILGMSFRLGGHLYATEKHLGYMFYVNPASDGMSFDLLVIRQGEQVDEHWGIVLPIDTMESVIKYLK